MNERTDDLGDREAMEGRLGWYGSEATPQMIHQSQLIWNVNCQRQRRSAQRGCCSGMRRGLKSCRLGGWVEGRWREDPEVRRREDVRNGVEMEEKTKGNGRQREG
jgi:hypothetical protein